MIKELTEKFKGPFCGLGEDTKIYMTFSVPIRKSDYNKTKKNGE